MSNTDNDVYDTTININNGGLVWSFKNAAKRYKKPAVKTNDIIVSEPVILGDVSGISGKSTIIHGGFSLKPRNSWEAGVPEPLAFAVDAAAFSTQNFLETFGAEQFYKSEFLLITQRTEIEPLNSGRPLFSQWHDHLNDINPTIMTYQFSDYLPTEIKSPEGDTLAPPVNTLLRMGAAITHRSATNMSESLLTRTWGAIVIYEGEGYKPVNGRPYNTAFTRENSDNVPPYDPANFGNNFKPYTAPKPLFG